MSTMDRDSKAVHHIVMSTAVQAEGAAHWETTELIDNLTGATQPLFIVFSTLTIFSDISIAQLNAQQVQHKTHPVCLRTQSNVCITSVQESSSSTPIHTFCSKKMPRRAKLKSAKRISCSHSVSQVIAFLLFL
jgi:hypothetical protein